jgi:NhaA family Na+:H+ antiporter
VKENSRGYYSINNFFDNQLLSGVIIIACVISAIIIANSPLSGSYFNVLNTQIGFSFGEFGILKSVKFWINDLFMTFFFLLIGFEIKRELIAGELSKIKKAVYPVLAAIGGIVFPIAIFLLLNLNKETVKGWGIPMSTDIAFVVSIMLVLGNRISKSLKISVTALAIIDDIGALLVIAIFYSTSVSPVYFIGIAALIAILLILNKLNIQFGIIYIFAGILLWVLFLNAGIHPTISGVLIAFLIPANTKINFDEFKQYVNDMAERIDEGFANRELHFEFADHESKKSIREMGLILRSIEPPLQRYEKILKSYVNFFIIPVFAFANSGISFAQISFADIISPLSIGIILGLMIGKSTGIFVFSVMSSRLKLAHLPEETPLKKVYGIGWLCGIGFTMSLFIAELSFTEEHFLNIAKASIFIGSILSALVGILIIVIGGKKSSI